MKFIVMGLLAILVGCGNSSKESNTSNRNKVPSHIRFLNMDQVAAASELQCSSYECNNSIGLMLLNDLNEKDKSDYFRCTSFVIDEYHIMTNSHCLPQAKAFRDVCYTTIRFVFGYGDDKEVYHCAEIVEFSDPTNSVVDYSIIKVDRRIRFSPLKMGLGENVFGNQQISVLSLDHFSTDEKLISRFSKDTCQTKENTLESGLFSEGKSPSLTYVGCSTVSGNSGSPIVNKDGKVIGIHQESYKPDALNAFSKSFALMMNSNVQQLPTFGRGTNFSCFCYEAGLPSINCSANQPSECLVIDRPSAKRKKEQLILSEVLSDYTLAYRGIDNIEAQYSTTDGIKYFAKNGQLSCPLELEINRSYEIEKVEITGPNCQF